MWTTLFSNSFVRCAVNAGASMLRILLCMGGSSASRLPCLAVSAVAYPSDSALEKRT